MWRIVALAVLVALSGARGQSQQSASHGVAREISYDGFMKLGQRDRFARWGELSADNRSIIMRTHAERWLERNRTRLTDTQISLVQEAIAFVSPELYRNPNDPGLRKREEELKVKLKCRLRRSDVMEAFGVIRSPVPKPTWREDVWAWIEDCVVGW